MSTPTPWTRLRKRLDGYEKKCGDRPDEQGFRASENVRHLQTLEAAVRREIDLEIVRARDQGAPWTAIPYGRSKQAAQQRHAAAVRHLAPRTGRRTVNED